MTKKGSRVFFRYPSSGSVHSIKKQRKKSVNGEMQHYFYCLALRGEH